MTPRRFVLLVVVVLMWRSLLGLTTFWAVIAAIVGSGLVVFVLDKALQTLRVHRRRNDLLPLFEDTDLPPYLIELETFNDTVLGSTRVTRRCYRVGVTANGTDPVKRVRVVVEHVDRKMLPDTLVLGYALRLADDKTKDAATVSPAEFAAPVFFDFVEQYLPTDHSEPSDWAWFCFRKTDEPMPLVPLGKTLVTLRVEAESGARPKRLKLWVQTRTPRGETLAGVREVHKTKLLVRKAMP